MLNQIRTGHFEADGGEHDLNLGYVPNYAKIINFNATLSGVYCIEWYQEFGDNVEIWHYIADSGVTTPVIKSSGGYISAYNKKSVDTGSAITPVYVGGGQGITIGADFMNDGHEIYYIAIPSHRDVDHGDIA